MRDASGFSDEEVLREIKSDSDLNAVRRMLSNGCGKLEQAEAQRKKPTPIERRRMEFVIAEEILEVIKVRLQK